MPLRYFNCPDGVTRPISECLEHCPRPEGRCLSLAALHDIGYDREWTGKASTTMLLNPTRQQYLKITKDYAVTPQGRAFALLGTRHHKRLEIIARKIEGLQAEKKGETAINTGTLDLLEPDELHDGKWKLIDYKTWGTYSITKIMNTDSHERLSANLQLNNYRMMVEPLNFPVSRMFWQITTRDGGTRTFREYGLDNRMPLIEADFLPDDFVSEYFYRKNKALMDALNNNHMPPLCDFDERWKGRRCKGELCEVHRFCPEGAKVNKVRLEE